MRYRIRFDKIKETEYNNKINAENDIQAESDVFIQVCTKGNTNEDTVMADSLAPEFIVRAMDAYKDIGMPEGELTLAHAVIRIASAETTAHLMQKMPLKKRSKKWAIFLFRCI